MAFSEGLMSKGGPRSISKTTRFEVFKRDSFTCQYCGRKAPDVVLELEHIHPVALGGTADILNLLTSCESCNDGKGARALDDGAVLEKQRKQVEALQVRREQIEMMLAWREGLRDLDEHTVTRVAEYASKALAPFELTPNGVAGIGVLLSKYSVDEVTHAIDVSVRQYLRYGDDGKPTADSVSKAWDYVGRIASVRKREKDKPELRDLLYARGIARNRCGYFNDIYALQLLQDAHGLGAEMDEIRDIAKTCRSWSNWRDEMDALIKHLEATK